MAKYCADCTYMGTCDDKGKFPCLNNSSGYRVVSARMPKCNSFTEAFNSRRCESEREEYMRISRSYGYYIITAISLSLHMDLDNEYIKRFAYLKDVILPNMENGPEWINNYDIEGPQLAKAIIYSKDGKRIAQHICSEYLGSFVALMEEGYYADALVIIELVMDYIKENLVKKRDVKILKKKMSNK